MYSRFELLYYSGIFSHPIPSSNICFEISYHIFVNLSKIKCTTYYEII